MIDWPVVIVALFLGMLLVLLLEASSRAGHVLWRWIELIGCLVAVLLLTGGLVWRRLPAADVPVTDVPVTETVSLTIFDGVVEADTAVSPLPPPSIFTLSATATPPIVLTPQVIHSATLAIPDLDIHQTIVDVPLQDGMWNVADLGENVGRLAGVGQHPGDGLAMVLAGHMTFPSSRRLLQGAFANLQYAIYGTEVLLQMDGEQVRYEVVQIERVDPHDVEQLRVYDGDSILLVTCTDWDENGRFYANRLLIRAERVDKRF